MRNSISWSVLFALVFNLSSCSSFKIKGTDSSVGVYRNAFMTTYDSFLSAAEHCLEHNKLAVLKSEANILQNDAVENYECVKP